MNIIDKQTVIHFHKSRIKEYNANLAKAQGWTSQDVQQVRFETIFRLADFNNASVLDVGCGYGDFKSFLDKKHISCDYIGLDQQTEFIVHAQEHFKEQSNTWFYEMDFSKCQLPKVAIVTACGVLSYYSTDSNYYIDMIQRFYDAAEQAFIFNMLDNKMFISGPLIVSHDREGIYQKCLEICPNTQLEVGYLNNDFTIKMSKIEGQ
jgi:SAM-dependent methyltransferase